MNQSDFSALSGKRVLVTGGTGFIGRRLVEALTGTCCANVRVMARNLARATGVPAPWSVHRCLALRPTLGLITAAAVAALRRVSGMGVGFVFSPAWAAKPLPVRTASLGPKVTPPSWERLRVKAMSALGLVLSIALGTK